MADLKSHTAFMFGSEKKVYFSAGVILIITWIFHLLQAVH
jgi:hypothetical protein